MIGYKCFKCYNIVPIEEVKVDGTCPVCGCTDKELFRKMCEADHICTCAEDVHPGIYFCPVCGEPTCPCGSADSAVTSRVTGFGMKIRSYFNRDLSDVAGWNAGKRSELKARHRIDILQ